MKTQTSKNKEILVQKNGYFIYNGIAYKGSFFSEHQYNALEDEEKNDMDKYLAENCELYVIESLFSVDKKIVDIFCDLVEKHGCTIWVTEQYREPVLVEDGMGFERWMGKHSQYVWGKDNAQKIVSNDPQEIRDFFEGGFEAEYPLIFLTTNHGSHHGMFTYTF